MIFYCFPFVHLTLFLNNLLPTYFTTSKIFYIQLFNYLCCTLLVLFGFKSIAGCSKLIQEFDLPCETFQVSLILKCVGLNDNNRNVLV